MVYLGQCCQTLSEVRFSSELSGKTEVMGVKKGEEEGDNGQKTGVVQSGVWMMRGILVKDEGTELEWYEVGK